MPTIAWWWSQSGPLTGYKPWDERPLSVQAGSAVWVRVAATSDSDMAAIDAYSNLVIPIEVEAARFNQQTGDYEHPLSGAENADVGQAPNYEVKFFTAERKWLPDFTWMGIYLLIAPAGTVGALPVLYSVTAEKEVVSMRLLAVE